MRKTAFAILATTALLSTGMLATRAEAMTPAPLGVAPAKTDLVQQAAVVCGPRGCVHRPTPIRRPYWNSWSPGWGGGPGWVVAGTPGMDADPVGRGKVEDVRLTDGDGESRPRTYL